MKNYWSILGSITFLVGGIGHFFVVDLSWWILNADFVGQTPSGLLAYLKDANVNWGFLGNQQVMNIVSGFSLWIVVSLIILGIYNLAIFRMLESGHKLRTFSGAICLVASIIFAVLALNCMIWPAMVGGVMAILFFAMSLKKELRVKKMNKS